MRSPGIGAVLAVTFAIAACGATGPSTGTQGGSPSNRDANWRDPSGSRSDTYAPARDPDRGGSKTTKDPRAK